MKVLVIGSGGREHALAWRIGKSKRVSKVFVAPGNAGTAQDANLTNIAANGVAEWLAFAKEEKIDLTVVGPEAPLAAGVVDAFRNEGLKVFGPTQFCAQLESSKDFAKAFMQRHGIPTAGYQTFTDAAAAHGYVDGKGAPIVIKADGLAAGKGVVVAMTLDEAHAAIDDMLLGNKMGEAGSRVVIEDFLVGEEASFIVMVDGEHVLPMATSQDHKRLLDNDQGPNTGGMGAYSPAPVVTPEVHNRVMREIIQPVVQGMKKDGHAYTGFLYAGLMIGDDGHPKVIEFNCRFGDPETQPIMARLKTDFTVLLEAGVNGRLDKVEAEWDRRVALGVVLAAAGYPDAPRKGDAIHGIPAESEDGIVFHAGTVFDEQHQLRASGGRVLCAVGLGDSVKMAQGRAYQLADAIEFAGKQFRRDIGARAIGRKH
ncbi:phosphoribosylamine--glycine ligase [Chromobacterium violaceum]|uniref:Phosphoribosylamine--glycine ligase n=1 Tax=Chromobacterium violaceum (strain ATCC 12472 / DSM 30191 / JCM 1249 / CCUG 213 / NBRC 12614 / NCIMB 9131 / NCTC 9757 / MK) TaxID=243365 RepID=Q7P0M0_CHRVO|nr:phosphoribosylamine--glycine ligase [Chromobacterium violaceum]AAQ58223.1 phosphoribosylamine-glycine ligase [Chromobacterium violaceum ATCC 12472]SUX40192.1 Phosphoribosylamine--glycine ligase [Chromobacterium violaceum]